MDLKQDIYVRVVAELSPTNMSPTDIARRAAEVAEAAAPAFLRTRGPLHAEPDREVALGRDASVAPGAEMATGTLPVRATPVSGPVEATYDEGTGRRGGKR